ncbi:MAG TPA: response regulator [Oligoflexus sp.]|uniref:response regulator n=1 Tax=Oligoflexus sp. TaxID=1971216 RepID=UPI002D481BEF|nr:response regulator [Oligoflexus sp.]HYX38182.1 response regulator [Oligoflexus sp.]
MSQEKFIEKVLIVEDDAGILDLIKEHIETAGVSTVTAANGLEGLARLQEHKVFMILSDYRMPQMDGLEFCREVRQSRGQLPFIILSAYADRTAVLSGVRSGVTDYADKPVDFPKLIDMVRGFAQKRQDQIKQDRYELETIRTLFIEEAHGILSTLDESILLIETDPSNKAEINKVFRKIHTLKGSAAAVAGGTTTSELAHAFESVLTSIKEGNLILDKVLVDLMLSSSDMLKQCIDAIENNSDSPKVQPFIQQFKAVLAGNTTRAQPLAQTNKAAPRTEKKDEGDEGVTVSNDKLDHFMELAGELVAFKNIFYGFVKQRISHLSSDDGLEDMNKALSKLTDELQTQIMDIRKVSLHKAFAKFPRMVRGIAQDLKKDVKYETEGLELQVDKTIAKALSGSLVHVIRNACDHGIEIMDKRHAKGKPELGTVRMVASQAGDMITLRVEDDGAGLDRDRIYAKAFSKGLVTQDISRMTDQEIFELLFIPGFSTAEVVSDLSGRGVGMDVVKTAVTSLGGTARFDAVKDKGTTLTIQVPVPKSIMVEQSIVARSSGILIAIPLSCISEIKPVKDLDFTYIKPFWMMEHNGKAIPIATYQQLIQPEQINRQKTDVSNDELVVVIMHKDSCIALRIDEVKDQLEAVVRPFDRITQVIPGFKGTSHLPGDQLAYMVSSEDFLKLVSPQSASAATSQAA